MVKGRDIVIGGIFGLGPDREQLTNLTELKNFKFKLIAAGSMHVLGVTKDGQVIDSYLIFSVQLKLSNSLDFFVKAYVMGLQ